MENKKNGLIFIVSGPSGSGKGTIVDKVMGEHDDIFLSISWTTRKPRGKEINGVNYHFVTTEEFDERIARGGFLEWARYATGDSYGTPSDPVVECIENGRDVILEIDVKGAMQVKEALPEQTVLVMLTPPSKESLEARLRGRNDGVDETVITKRLNEARKEIQYLPQYDYYICNDDNMQDKCKDDLYSIMRHEHVSRGHLEKRGNEHHSSNAELCKSSAWLSVIEKFN